jgi:hypothetical protein
VFNRGVRRTATVAISAALLAAGCGGGGGGPSSTQQSTTVAQSAPRITTTITLSSAETKRVETHSNSARSTELKATAGYTCGGKKLRALSANGPVKVEPPVVKPGQSFTVLVTDRHVKVVQVTLTGVSATPIVANGVGADDGIAARLKMPASATCGNKLLEIEGDLSAEAYVGVSE